MSGRGDLNAHPSGSRTKCATRLSYSPLDAVLHGVESQTKRPTELSYSALVIAITTRWARWIDGDHRARILFKHPPEEVENVALSGRCPLDSGSGPRM